MCPNFTSVFRSLKFRSGAGPSPLESINMTTMWHKHQRAEGLSWRDPAASIQRRVRGETQISHRGACTNGNICHQHMHTYAFPTYSDIQRQSTSTRSGQRQAKTSTHSRTHQAHTHTQTDTRRVSEPARRGILAFCRSVSSRLHQLLTEPTRSRA